MAAQMIRNRRGILKKDIESCSSQALSWESCLWNRRGILKKDIESYMRDSQGCTQPPETEEESWKRILKVHLPTKYLFRPQTKQKRNPEKGYWKPTSLLSARACRTIRNRRGILKKDIESLHPFNPFPFRLQKQKRNPEKGYWKIYHCCSPWTLYETEEESWKRILKDITSGLLLFWLGVETEEESWKRILKALNSEIQCLFQSFGNRRGILKKDIESNPPYNSKGIHRFLKQKRNPEKGYWKGVWADMKVMLWVTKQKRNPEKGYWKLLKKNLPDR